MLFHTVILFLFHLNWILHPVHVSITNIDISTVDKEINFSIRLFHDDLSIALYYEYHDFMGGESADSLSERDFADEYVKSKIIITGDNNQQLDFTLNEKETTDDSVIMHYSCKLPDKKMKSVQLTNDIFFNIYPDQKNLVIVNLDGNENGYTLTNGNNSVQLL